MTDDAYRKLVNDLILRYQRGDMSHESYAIQRQELRQAKIIADQAAIREILDQQGRP